MNQEFKNVGIVKTFILEEECICIHTTTKKYKYILRVVAALLKENGFKNRNGAWERDENGIISTLVINLTKNTKDEKIFYPRLFHSNTSFQKKSSKKSKFKVDLMRLNRPLTRRSYEVDDNTDEKFLALELVATIKKIAFGWFEMIAAAEKKVRFIEVGFHKYLRMFKFRKCSDLEWRRKVGGIIHIVGITGREDSHLGVQVNVILGSFSNEFYMLKYDGTYWKDPVFYMFEKADKNNLTYMAGVNLIYITKDTDEVELMKQIATLFDVYAIPWFKSENEKLRHWDKEVEQKKADKLVAEVKERARLRYENQKLTFS